MKRLHLVLVFMLLLIVGIPTAFSQSKNVTGKILDASGQPIVAATVTAAGSKISTLTNSEGVFSLTVPANVTRLAISSVGFAAQEVSISGKNDISVTLQASSSQLNKVIVTALGLERNKKALQFSATQVSGEN